MIMGQKCRKYRKARKNRVIPDPHKKLEYQDKNKNAFKGKCKGV
jgi:hypothetical protein